MGLTTKKFSCCSGVRTLRSRTGNFSPHNGGKGHKAASAAFYGGLCFLYEGLAREDVINQESKYKRARNPETILIQDYNLMFSRAGYHESLNSPPQDSKASFDHRW